MSDGGPSWPSGDDATGAPPPPPPPPQPSPPPAGQAPGGATAGQSADIGVRLVARLIDYVLLWFVSAIILVPVVLGSIFTDVGMGSTFGIGASVGGFVAQLLIALIAVGYFAYLESSRGATLGKQLMSLKVQGPDGGLPSMEVAFKRNAWLLASIIPIVGGLVQLGLVIWIIVSVSGSPTNQGVHDEFAGGTRVVRA